MIAKSATHVECLLMLAGVLHKYLKGDYSLLSASIILQLISPSGTSYCIQRDLSKLIRNFMKSHQIPKDYFLLPQFKPNHMYV